MAQAAHPAVAEEEFERLPGGWADYAPSGLPDFSQCRAEWSRAAAEPGDPAQWTHAGPVAVANALWWLDSRAEPFPRPPREASDGHALITAYPVFGRPPDDHDAANLAPLVNELAARSATDGLGRTERLRGTRWSELVAGTRAYVERRRLSEDYPVTTKLRPDGAWLAARVAEEAGVVLLLGLWERQGEAWRRVGGHYAALAGASPDGQAVLLSDPLLDSAGAGGPGVALPADPTRHSCREAAGEHDDAAVVSHDAYDLFPPPDLPGAPMALAAYFTPVTSHHAAAFAGQNPAAHLAEHDGKWQGGVPVLVLDAALAITPRGAGRRAPAPTGTPTPSPTATASPAPPTLSPTATAALPVLPTVAASPTAPWSVLPVVRPVGWAWLPIVVRERR